MMQVSSPTSLRHFGSLSLIGGMMIALAAAPAQASVVSGTLSLQQGVAPSASYTMDASGIRSDQATTTQNNGQIIVGHVGGARLRGVMEFDLSALTDLANGQPIVIDKVSLTLTNLSSGQGGAGGMTFDLHLLGDGGSDFSFSESTVTWNNAPDEPGGTIGQLLTATTFVPTVAGDRVFDDSPEFRQAIANALTLGDQSIRFLLKANVEGTSGNNFARFNSNSVSPPSNRPALTIEYTIIPEPASLALAGLGGALMLLRRR